eukprot:GHVT01019262.1.p2 GENE.GHVT01019262.1~~GHVT01019262.1.p2  ORF type:complete len:134 (+),score=39.39 GHVT01019262.1:3393-3794(+)
MALPVLPSSGPGVSGAGVPLESARAQEEAAAFAAEEFASALQLAQNAGTPVSHSDSDDDDKEDEDGDDQLADLPAPKLIANLGDKIANSNPAGSFCRVRRNSISSEVYKPGNTKHTVHKKTVEEKVRPLDLAA